MSQVFIEEDGFGIMENVWMRRGHHMNQVLSVIFHDCMTPAASGLIRKTIYWFKEQSLDKPCPHCSVLVPKNIKTYWLLHNFEHMS